MAGRSNAKGVRIDGFWFDSGAEARRYQELRLGQASKLIYALEIHPTYPLKVNGKLICKYEADFRYMHLHKGLVVEDVKGQKTDVFKLKHKLFEALYDIKLLITPASDYRAPRAKRRRR